MKLNKTIALSTVIILGALNLVGCNNSKADTNEKTNIKVGMVSDVGGINDESFNQSAYEGLQQAEKDLGIEIKVIESKQASEYLGNIETLADEGMDLIIGVGNTMAADIKTQAENYPEQQFAIIDETYDEIPENVTPILFKENEASYLTGLIAGKMTETNNVGFIGGMDNTVISRFLYGYMAGVKEANKDAEINVQYAGTFADAAKGTGLGAIESSKEQNKYAIGVDKDQSDLAPKNVITSALKKVNVGVYDTVKELVNGNLDGGEAKVYGLKQNGVGIPETTKNLVSQEIIDYVNDIIEKIKNGNIEVPETKEEYDAMNA